MNAHKIFLFDLSHTGRGYISEFIPLAIGCIKAHLIAHSRHASESEVRLFKDPQKAIDSYLQERPAVVGFSNYSWNYHLGTSIAREIKAMEPRTLILFGGPNYPLECEGCEKWLRK